MKHRTKSRELILVVLAGIEIWLPISKGPSKCAHLEKHAQSFKSMNGCLSISEYKEVHYDAAPNCNCPGRHSKSLKENIIDASKTDTYFCIHVTIV